MIKMITNLKQANDLVYTTVDKKLCTARTTTNECTELYSSKSNGVSILTRCVNDALTNICISVEGNKKCYSMGDISDTMMVISENNHEYTIYDSFFYLINNTVSITGSRAKITFKHMNEYTRDKVLLCS